MPLPDVIELFNSRGEVVQMFKQPKKYEDKVVIDRKDKGKEKAILSDSEEEVARIIIAGIVNGTPKIDRAINEALNDNLWCNSGKKQENASKSTKDFYENNWQQVPIKSQASTSGWHQPPLEYSNQWMEQPVASLSQLQKKPKKWVKLDLAAVEKVNINLARQQYLSNQKDRYHYTHPKRVVSNQKSRKRVEANFVNAKKHNGNVMIRLRGKGWHAHSLEKPIWDIPGYCYLAAIKDEMLNQRDWPAFPNLRYLSQVHYKYQKNIPFQLKATLGGNYHLEVDATLPAGDSRGWKTIDHLARSAHSFHSVGGDNKSLTASILVLNGTNYHQWASQIKAYIQVQGLWKQMHATHIRPTIMRPTLIIPEKTAESTAEKLRADYKIDLAEYEKDLTKQEEWDLDGQKVLGIITLKISQNFSYFIKETALQTWVAIKKAFDSAGAAAIYADYKAAITFKMNPREDPALEISKLQTILERLVSKRLPMNDMVAAMTAIVAMPDNWDHVASLILSTTEIDDLNIPHIVPGIQEEYKRRQAKGQVPKKANIARVKLPNAPKRQEWKGNQQQQVNQQAGPSIQRSPYLNRNFKKFQPRNNNNNQHNAGTNYYQQNNQNSPQKGPNWERNRQNHSNKKMAKQLLIEKVDKLENQTKKSDKGKGKMINLASYETFGKPKLLQRIDQIKEEDLLLKRMETIESFRARGFSIDDNIEKSLKPIARIEEITEDTEMISLGSEDEDREAQYYEADWNQYVIKTSKILADKNTVMTIAMKLMDSFSSSKSRLLKSTNSHSIDSEINKFYSYNCVKASANLKKCFNIDKSTDIWIVDSGASHDITNNMSDFTEYIP